MVTHPAQYSKEVIDLLKFMVPRLARVHDCYAGAGVRLGFAADDRGWTFTGTELQAAFIVDERVSQGDATDAATYPASLVDGRGFTVVTSPVYPNGMADHFRSAPADGSRRRTYRHAHAAILGEDVPLHPNNMARWGYRSSASLNNDARLMYWSLARRTVACWGGAERVIVNVSDFLAGDRRVPVVAPWCQLLIEHGWHIDGEHEVQTRRWRDGANRDQRVEAEVVIDAWRTAP
jgi:hypothetical protein